MSCGELCGAEVTIHDGTTLRCDRYVHGVSEYHSKHFSHLVDDWGNRIGGEITWPNLGKKH